jgi:hypothetical protein
MFKNIIAPVQTWLLARGQCVGCGMPLKKGKIDKKSNDQAKIACKCGRIFIHNLKDKTYRRALFDEV